MYTAPLQSWAEMRAQADAAERSKRISEATRLYQSDLEAERSARDHVDDFTMDAAVRPSPEAVERYGVLTSRAYLNLLEATG